MADKVFNFLSLFTVKGEVSFFKAQEKAKDSTRNLSAAAASGSVQQEKLSARLFATETRLKALSSQEQRILASMKAHTTEAAHQERRLVSLSGSITRWTQDLAYNESAGQRAAENTKKLGAEIFALNAQMKKLSADMVGMENPTVLAAMGAEYDRLTTKVVALNAERAVEQEQVKLTGIVVAELAEKIAKATAKKAGLTEKNEKGNAVLDIEREKLAYTGAQIAVKTARVHELTGAMNPEKPKGFFGQMKASALEAFSSFEKLSMAVERGSQTFDRLTRGVSRAQKIINGFYGMATGGKELFPVHKVKEATVANQEYVGSLTKAQLATLTLRNPVKGLSLSFLAASVAVGQLAANLVQTGVASLMSFAQASVGAVSEFEKLSLSMKSMAARELQNTDSSLSFADAMSQAAPRAQELLKWTERLAILSPFSVEDIKSTLQMAMSMGMTSDQAQRVTQALTNWAAAVGKGGAEIQRAVYALSQMSAAGKLTGQDVMQLSQLGISVDQILGKSFNKTTTEIRDMREKGLIPAGQAIEAVLADLEKFGSAAADQANSFSGLMSSLGDLASTSGRNLFGPLITETKHFGESMNDELGDIADQTTTRVGGLLGAIQPKLGALVSLLGSDLFQDGLTDIAATMNSFATDMFDYGENIVMQLADGMVSALWAVMDAISNIGSLIAGWLMPGSPPKILPDLDKWGAGAMMAYLDGFKDVDFGQFQELTGTIESFLGSLGKGIIPEVDLNPMLMGMRTAVTAALASIKGGGDKESAIQGIMGSMGSAGASLENYVRALLDVEQASAGMTAAQKVLNDATEKYNKLLEPLEKQLNDIDDATQKLQDAQEISRLELVMNDPNATLAEKEMARLKIARIRAEAEKKILLDQAKLEVDAAQAGVDAEAKKEDAAAAELERQKQLLGIQQKNNELVNRQLELLERLAKEGEGGDGGGGGGAGKPKGGGTPFGGGVNPFEEVESEFKEKWEAFIATFTEKAELIKSVWTKTWDAIKLKLQPVFDALQRFQDGPLADLLAMSQEMWPQIQELVAEVFAFIVKQIATVFPGIIDTAGESISALADFWEKHGDTIMKVIGFIIKVLITTFTTVWLIVATAWKVGVDIVTGIVEVFLLFWDMLVENFHIIFDGLAKAAGQFASGDFAGAWKTIQDTIGLVWENVKVFIADAWVVIQEKLGSAWETIKTNVGIWLQSVANIIGVKLEETTATWSSNWENFWEILGLVWEKIKTTVSEKLTAAYNYIVTKLTELKTWWDTTWTTISTKLSEIWTTITTTVSAKVLAIWTAITTKISELKLAWDTFWLNVGTTVSTTWENIKLWVGTAIAEMVGKVTTKMDALDPEWRTKWENIKTSLSEKWDAMVLAVSNKVEEVRLAVSEKVTEIQTKWNEIWTAVSTKVSEIWTAISTTVSAKALEIWTAVSTKLTEIKTKWDEIWLGISTTLSAKWLEIATTVSTKLAEVKKNWDEVWTSVSTKLSEIWAAIVLAVETKIGEVKTSVTTGIQGAYDEVVKKLAGFKTFGADIVQGMIDGIVSMAGALALAVINLVSSIFTTATDEAESESPSRRAMKEIGKPISQGAAIGISANLRPVQKAARLLVETAIQPPLSGAYAKQTANTTYNSASPTFNLTENYRGTPRNPARSFAIMQALSRHR